MSFHIEKERHTKITKQQHYTLKQNELMTNKTRNKFEKKIESQLKKAQVKFSYETEKIPYIFSGHYIPDFVILTEKGKIYIETKGHFRPEDKRKLAAVKKLNPAMDLRLLFYSYKKKDSKWADKYNMKWAVGDIPEEWLNGL